MRILSTCLCFMILFSCGVPAIYQETIELGDKAWSYSDKAKFSFSIDDIESKYDLFLDVNYGLDFPYENLYIKLNTTFPDQTSVSDTLSIQMIGDQGQWLGKCGGEDCDLKVFLQENIKFRAIGSYELEIEQFTRSTELRGVNAISFSIHSSKAKG